MPQATILNPFVLRLRGRNQREFLRLDELPSEESFQDVFVEFLQSIEAESHVDQDAEKGLKAAVVSISGQVVDGQLKSGEFGTSAELENIQTGEVRQKGADDCEYIPLYFRAEFRAGANEAIIVMQRLGVRGAKSVFMSALQAFIDDRYRNAETQYTLYMNPLITQAAVEEALGGGIEKIHFLMTTIPEDIADALKLDDNEEVEGEMELVIKTKRGIRWQLTNWMRGITTGRVAVRDYLEISGVEYEKIKLTVNVNGRSKIVALEDVTETLRMNVDVSADVEYGDDGHPSIRSVKRAVVSRMPEFRQGIGWAEQ